MFWAMPDDGEQEAAVTTRDRGDSNAAVANADPDGLNDARALVPPMTRSGDVIS